MSKHLIFIGIVTGLVLSACGRGLYPVAGAGSLQVSVGAAYSFGARYAGQSYDVPLTLTNTGEGSISGIEGSTSRAAPFGFKGGAFPGSGGTCASELGANQSCTVVISFSPSISGTYQGNLSFMAGGASGPTIALTGTGLGGGAVTSFGSEGVLLTTLSSFEFDLSKIAEYPDGTIAVHGQDHSFAEFSILRLTSTGSIDSSYGTNGRTTLTVGALGAANLLRGALVTESTGQALVAGSANFGPNWNLVITRYTSVGTFDSTFSGDGIVVHDIQGASQYDQPGDAAIQSDGKILVVGATSAGGTLDPFVLRLTSAGAPDATFGTGGEFVTALGTGGDSASAVLIDTQGRYLIGGNIAAGGGFNADYFIMRLQTNGVVDSTFGTNGITSFGTPALFASLAAMRFTTDGKILALGRRNGNIVFLRLDTDGAIDSSFGVAGIATTNVVGPQGNAFAISSDGKYLAGTVGLARFHSDGSRDTTFGISGILSSTEILPASLNLADFKQVSGDQLLILARETGGAYRTIVTRRVP